MRVDRLPTGNIYLRISNKAVDLHAEGEIVQPTLEDLAEETANQKSLDMRRGKPVAFIFGPEHGPVTEQMVYAAAKKATSKVTLTSLSSDSRSSPARPSSSRVARR